MEITKHFSYLMRVKNIFPPGKQGSSFKIFLPNLLDAKICITGTPGQGAGKGGGAGGTVRESGGSLGRYGAAKEEEYFYRHQREQLEKMKTKLKKDEVAETEEKTIK